MTTDKDSIERRLRALEDQIAIYQSVCGYGYAVDGMNGEAVGALYADDGVYAVEDVGRFQGRDQVAGIATDPRFRQLVAGGVAHVSTLPYVVIAGDRASATCHTVILHGDTGFYINRVSASRHEMSKGQDGGWHINHRQNYMLTGNPAGPAMLARLKEAP